MFGHVQTVLITTKLTKDAKDVLRLHSIILLQRNALAHQVFLHGTQAHEDVKKLMLL